MSLSRSPTFYAFLLWLAVATLAVTFAVTRPQPKPVDTSVDSWAADASIWYTGSGGYTYTMYSTVSAGLYDYKPYPTSVSYNGVEVAILDDAGTWHCRVPLLRLDGGTR